MLVLNDILDDIRRGMLELADYKVEVLRVDNSEPDVNVLDHCTILVVEVKIAVLRFSGVWNIVLSVL